MSLMVKDEQTGVIQRRRPDNIILAFDAYADSGGDLPAHKESDMLLNSEANLSRSTGERPPVDGHRGSGQPLKSSLWSWTDHVTQVIVITARLHTLRA